MSETGVVLPGRASHPSIVHEPTRRALAPGERLDGRGLVNFRPLTGPSPLTMHDHLVVRGGDPAELDPALAGLLLFGHLIVDGYEEGPEVVLDGAAGRVFSMCLYEKRPAGAVPAGPVRRGADALPRRC
ncbi:hypothetical protein [Streptomyces barringtoniae]|uniref:hypothetical protein n=1 Tax=Streptomyces barringtoniae TaxID=2892029 RepID=UPI001E4C74D2|nr:hypothetical protein [Streptomyces barringtoniae]MCC5474655.1 hypothetical protein [Streptomyces barringtoniae]